MNDLAPPAARNRGAARLRGRAVAVSLFLAVGFVTAAQAARADGVRAVQGPVILAKAGASAEYLWNASTYVAQLTTDKRFGDAALHDIEATALTTLAEKAKTSSATTVSMKVIYALTGDVSPVYRSATFVGMEKVFSISAARADLLKHADDWVLQLERGQVPSAVKLDLTGKLPPPTP